jgi:peptide/nickel transport system permease protein
VTSWIGLVARRVAAAFALLWIALSLVFVLTQIVPGDPARALVGPHADAATVTRVRARLCLDRSPLVQYGCFVGRIARFDLGTSLRDGRPVAALLAERAGASAELAVAAVAIQLLVAVPLAAIGARRRSRVLDRAAQLAAVTLQSAPPFVLGLLLVYVVSYRLGWLPVRGRGEPGLDRLRHLALPAITLAAGGVASSARLLRGELADALDQGFVRAARARGASPLVVWARHVAPHAAGPLIALAGMDLGALLGGAPVVEYLFGWPGLGREAALGVLELDLPLILGVVTIACAAVVAVNLVVDLAHAALDPRLRHRAESATAKMRPTP